MFSVRSDVTGDYVVPNLSKDAAPVVNDFLKRNHKEFDIFFDDVGRHNHTMHHLLTIYALGADANAIRNAFNGPDKVMQRPKPPVSKETVESFKDSAAFMKGLGKRENFSNYVEFFTGELRTHSYQELIHEYYFKGDEKSKAMFNRLFASVIHPLIHLGFALEFEQPALVVEALAETAVHEDEIGPLFAESERLAQSGGRPRNGLASIVQTMSTDEKMRGAAMHSDGLMVRSVVLGRELDQMAAYASQWTVDPSDLDRANAESANAAAFLMAAAQRKDKIVKMDFFTMHCVTSSIFISTFLRQDWISAADKAKIITYKGRTDLFEFAAAKSPGVYLDEITNYRPVLPNQTWADIFQRSIDGDDDGHIPKTVRALAHAAKISKPYEASDRFVIKGEDTWLKIGNMVVDSAADGHVPGKIDHWIWGTGFDERWAKFRNRVAA